MLGGQGPGLCHLCALTSVLDLGRARHVASAERSCRTQQAGQAEPRKDIKREADGGMMEVLQRQSQITPSP